MLDAARFSVPYAQHTNFVGRDEDLARLHAALSGGNTVGINAAALSNHIGVTGQGGIGKTQLAVEYAYRYQDHYPDGVYWLNAAVDLRQEFSALAAKLNLPLPGVLATNLSVPDRQRLVDELASGPWLLGDAMSRWALLKIVGLGHFATGLNLNGSSREVAATLVARLESFGFMPDRPTHQALGSLLGYLVMLPDIPPDTAQWLSSIIQRYGLITITEATQSQDEHVQAAFAWLRAHPHSLLILDNVADPAVLGQSLTRDCVLDRLPCRLLFTTRRRAQGRFRPFELKTLPPDAALKLLLRDTRRQPALDPTHLEYQTAADICAVFGYLPLPLEIAAAHLAKFPTASLATYRDELLRRGALDVMADRRINVATRHENGLAAALAAQWAVLGDEAQRLLRVAGQLPEAAYIPAARLGLLAGVSEVGRSFFDVTLDVALTQLQDASLVEEIIEEPTGKHIRLHPLVREFARDRTPPDEKETFRAECVRRLLTAFGDIETLERQCDRRGIDALLYDLLTTKSLLEGIYDKSMHRDLGAYFWVLRREARSLRGWQQEEASSFLAQQLHLRSLTSDIPALFGDLATRSRVRGSAMVARWTTLVEPLDLELKLLNYDFVTAIAITPEGRRIVSGDANGSIRVWNLSTGRLEGILRGTVGVTAIVVTLDGQQIISGDANGSIRVWNLDSRSEERTLTGHRSTVWDVAVTPDGHRVISCGGDGILRIWNLKTGQEEWTRSGRKDGILAVAVTPDGRRVVCGGSNRSIRIWNLDTRREEQKLIGLKGRVQAIAVTPDGRRVVSGGYDGTVHVWDLDNRREEWSRTGHKYGVETVAVMPDGRRVVSGGADGTVRVWDLDTGREEWSRTGHMNSVKTVAVTPDGRRVVSGGADGRINVWDLATTDGQKRILGGNRDPVWAIVVPPGRRQVISASSPYLGFPYLHSGNGAALHIWDLAAGREEQVLNIGYQVGPAAAAVTPDGRRVISNWGNGELHLWDLARGREEWIKRSNGLRNLFTASAVAVTADGRRVVSSEGYGVVRVFDLATGKEERTLSGQRGSRGDMVRNIVVMPDGQRVVSGWWDGTLRVWDIDNRREETTLTEHQGGIRALAVLPDGKNIISGGDLGTICVWNLDTGKANLTLLGHVGGVQAVAVMLGGQYVVSGGLDQTLRLWDLGTGHELGRVVLDAAVMCIAVVPDRPLLVIAGDAAGNLYCLERVK